MKATSLPNLNRESTSYHNFFTFFQDPNHHDDTTLHKRPNIDHSQVSEPSETSPFKDILSPFVSFNESNKNHYPVGGFFCERDQKDQTLPRRPPSSARSTEATVSVGSNPFCGSVGARSEGPNVTQLRGDQTLPSMSSVGSYQSSSNVGARSAGLIFSQSELPRDKTEVTIQTLTTITARPDLDEDFLWRKYGQKDILNARHPRNYFSCTHRFDQGCQATKEVQKTDEDPPMYQTTYSGNHTCSQSELPRDKRRVTTSDLDDDFSWRKYGQRDILNARHPKNYFRCSHEFDKGCQATKVVQQTDEDPPMYQTTYYGNHTCTNPRAPRPILDATDPNFLIFL